MNNIYFTNDSYKTGKDKERVFWDKASFGTSAYFITKFAYIILKCRSIAVKGRFDTEELIKASRDMLKHVEDCGGKVKIEGMDNLRKCKGPVVFISNHMSTLETMIFPCIIAPLMKVNFIVKEGNINNPFFGPIMRSLNPISVTRSNSRKDFEIVINKGKELLSDGTSIIVFPQGSRKTDFNPAEFNSIGMKLAVKAGVQVIPIAIKTDFWENGKIFRDIGTVNRKKPIYISFGEPMTPSGNGRNEHKEVIEFIDSHLKKWGHFDAD